MRDARKCLFLRLWPNQLQQRCEEEVRVHGRCKKVSVFKAIASPAAAEIRLLPNQLQQGGGGGA